VIVTTTLMVTTVTSFVGCRLLREVQGADGGSAFAPLT